MFKKLISLVAVAALSVMGLYAQQFEQLPQDPELRKGVLENGLTYYIRHNATPAGQADFYIYDKVGAIQEEDLQIGLAHFLEHMAFNGTKNFPDKEMINYLESIGVKFGANLNAWTAMEQTQYMMQSVPVSNPEVVDKVLLILHDWAYYINLEEEEIDNERGVIVEELRTRNDANWRIREQMSPYLYGNTKYAERNIIGTEERLRSFTYDELRDFYHRWYNTKNQCIVIIGDFDAAEMEQKVINLFSTIPAVENPEEIAYIPIPACEEPQVAILTDPEVTESSVEVILRSDAMPKELNNTIVYEQMAILDGFISTIMNERLADIAQKPNAPFLGAYYYNGSITRSMDICDLSATSRDGETLTSLEALYTEFEKARRYGFTQSEFERAQTNLMRRAQQAYDRRNDRRHGQFVRQYTENFSNNTPLYSAEQEWQIDSLLYSAIDLNTVNNFAQQGRLVPQNMVVMVTVPTKEGVENPTAEQVKEVLAKVSAAEIAAPAESGVKEPLIPAGTKLKGSKVKTTSTDSFGNTVWTLKNGVKVVLKPTDFKADEIHINGYALGGTSILADEDMTITTHWGDFIGYQGVGKFSVSDWQKQLAGKAVRIQPSLAATTSGLYASCSPKDLETALQLIWLYGNSPRYDEDAFNMVKDQLVSQYSNIESDPMYQFARDLFKHIYNRPDRWRRLSAADVEAMTFEQFKRVYTQLYNNFDDYTYIIVGNFQEAELKPLVEKYLGSMPKNKAKAAYNIENLVTYQSGVRNEEIAVAMQMPKVSVACVLSGEMEVNLKNDLSMSILRQILDIRYTKSIREEKGGTYGVGVGGQNSGVPAVPDYMLLINFDTNTEMAEELSSMLIPEIEKIATEGPAAEDLAKIKEYLLKTHTDNVKQNGNWVSWIRSMDVNGVDYVTGYNEVVEGITADDIKAVAAKVLADNNKLMFFMKPAE